MANTPNVELEAAKFLHKLIQESKDEPTKLATKLYVILQHMRSSGKENSMPYQVISRAMETVIKQHNLDIEALMSSRLPVAAGAQVGDSSSSQLAGSSQRPGVVNNVKASLPMNEVGRPDGHASSRGQVGPSSSGQDIYRGKASHTSVSTNVHGAIPGASGSYPAIDSGISNPMHFGSSSYENHGLAPKMQNEKITESYSAAPSFDLSATRSTAGKAVDHEGATNMIANKAIQGGIMSNATETSMLKSVAPRDTGKSPASSAPFKEQQLRQLRAQCLVFLAFRNGLMPKKLHLEIALGNILPKDDVLRREQSVNDPSNLSEVTRPFGRVDTARETDRMTPGSSSAGILAETNLSKGAENSNVMDDRSGLPTGQPENLEDGKHHFTTKKPEAEETTESQSAPRGLQPDSNARGLAVSYNRNDLRNTGQFNGTSNQASFSVGTGHARKDNANNQSPAECPFQASRFADSNLPGFQSREQWTPISGVDVQNPSTIPVKDTDTMVNNSSQVQESDPEEENNSISTDRPPSPKYTTVDKWILDRQKRKILTEQKWVQKQQKTEKKIAACFDKLKESVSSSEDIFAKTKSVIELKKLQLLDLQRRLRSDILNDFFKPIATDMDRLKSIKKHRIGRKSKQLERYEQRMKEERQKRFRERQKEFFGEIEVHRERLEDIFKMRRERWKGFNRFVREFHKRKERIHREKIDRIQREKINLLKINDVEGYLRMVQDAKSDRVKQLLKETEKYLSKLGAKLQDAKAITRRFETEMDESRSTGFVEKTETAEDEDDLDQAKHYLESNEKYYMMAHSIKENITEQPACLVGGKLREYQMNGLRWLVSLYNNHLNGILADEMGLGKTVQVISLICYLMENKNDRGPFLVVVPSSVLPGWESEINFWAPSIHKIVYSGPPEERRRLFKEQIVSQKFNVLLTTYEYLMNKHDRPKLSKLHWHYIIIDEGHRIKNASCKLNADLKHYRSNHRLLLTGTPLQNNLEELWALLNFLLPNIFNSSEDFSQWFNKPFESNGDNSPDEALLSEEENLLIINRLHQVLRPFVLRRLKHKVENQLPEKIERLVRCEASAYQKLLMKRVEENLGAIGTSKARSVHNSVMELRNICNHPYLSQLHVEEVHELLPKHYLPNIVRLCGKLEMLDRLLPKLKATDHRVLLFSTMTRLLDVMEDYLYWKQYRYLRLDGHTSGGDRGALIDLFNQPNSPFFIFLLSIRAGGVGVNLQAADTVIIFDTDWNPQVDLQAQARAHRIGQKKDVLVLRLETVQTVEEQVRAAAEHKLGVANQSITAGFFDNNTSAEDRREYLESLLRECKKEEAAPVLDDDALNDLIARSESEIDIFESVDKRRREEEMAEWKQLVTEKGAESLPLPPRLLTDDDLRAFYEVMMITEAPHPGVASTAGVKRKGEYLGGLDTQQYGRGKRAREVRSYEEQWTEEEFERMCQVDPSGSPNYMDPNTEKKLASVTSGSIMATGEKLESALPQMHIQPTFEPTGQQNKEVTPPPKRGRGRPKRAVAVVNVPAPVAPALGTPAPAVPTPAAPAPSTSPPVALSALSGVSNTEAVSSGNTAGHAILHGPDSFPSNTSRRSITGNINQVGVSAASSPQSSSVPSVGPASQSTHFSAPARGRGRGRKAQTGEASRRRGRRQNLVLQDVPVTSMPSESEMPGTEKQGVVIPSSSTVHAGAPITVLQSSSVTEKANVGAQQNSNLSSSVVPDPESDAGFPAMIGTGKEDHNIKVAPAEPSTSLPSVISASTTLSQSEPRQGRGRGRKPQIGGEAPSRRGKRQDSATPIIISGSADQDLKSMEPPQKKSRGSAGRRVSARNKQDNEPQILITSIQSNIAQTTSGPAVGHVHNGEQENESQEKRNVAKSDTYHGGTNPAGVDVSVAAAKQDIEVNKDIPHESPLSEIKKDASPGRENIDSQAARLSSSNEVSTWPSLCGETGSTFSSESTAQNSDLKHGEDGSQSGQKGREKDPQQLTDAIKSADPSTGKTSDVDVDVENHTTASKEIKCQIVLPETARRESLGGESSDTPNLPSSSKTCIEDVKGQLLDDSHTSASLVGLEVPLEKMADEMPETQVRKENGENAVLQDTVADAMHEINAGKLNGVKNVHVDSATNDISESQAGNKDAQKEGQLHDPLVDRNLGVLALSAPTSNLSLVHSENNMGKLRDQEKEDPALMEVLVSNLPTIDAAAPSVNYALNNTGDLSAKEERLHHESEDPASCVVTGPNVDINASVDTCCGDDKDHTLGDTPASTLRSSDIADTTTDKMCEDQANKEDMEKEGLVESTHVSGTSDMSPSGEHISDLSLVRADSHSGKVQAQEKENPIGTEVLSSFPTSDTPPSSTEIALNNSGDLYVKEDISGQDSKVYAPCDTPRLNSDLLASTETRCGAVKDQPLDDTTASTLKSSAVVDSITNETYKGQDNKDGLENEGQVQNPSTDETSALLDPNAPASNLSLLQADSHLGKLEDQEMEDINLPTTDENEGQVQNPPTDETSALSGPNAPAPDLSLLQADSHLAKQEGQEMEDINLPTTDDAPPNGDIALDNSSEDLSGKEDRIDQVSKIPAQCDVSGLNSDLPASIDTCCGNVKDQALDETSASTFRSSNMVDGTTDEIDEAQSDKGDMEKEGLMQNALVGKTSDVLAPCEPASDLSLIPAVSPSRKLEAHERVMQNALGSKTSVMLAPCEPASDLSLIPAESPSRKLEAHEKEVPVLTEVLFPSLLPMETAPPFTEIPLNNNQDVSAKEDTIDQASKNTAPCDAPSLRLDLPASFETCSGNVEAQCLDDISVPATTDSSMDKNCGHLASEEKVDKEGHEHPLVDETPSILATGTPVSDSSLVRVDCHSEKPEDGEKKDTAVYDDQSSSLATMGTLPASVEIAVSRSGDPSGRDYRIEEESKDLSPCYIAELKPDLPVSTQSCSEDVKDLTLDGSHASMLPLSSACAVDSTASESCKGQAGEEDGGRVGEVKEPVEVLASELLTVGDHSHCGESAVEEKKDPARSEVLASELLTVGDHSHFGEPAGGKMDPARSEVLASELTVGDHSHCGESAAEGEKDPARSEVLASELSTVGVHSHYGESAAEEEKKDPAQSEVLTSELLTVGDQSNCGKPAGGGKMDPARSEVLASELLMVGDHIHCGESAAAEGKKDPARSEVLASELLTVGDHSHCGESAEEKKDPARGEILASEVCDQSHCGELAKEEGKKDSARSEVLAEGKKDPARGEILASEVCDHCHCGELAKGGGKKDSARSEVLAFELLTVGDHSHCRESAAGGEKDSTRSEVLASELLTVGHQSYCRESAEEENKNDPARSEMLESSILPITDHSHCGGPAAGGGENDSARSEVLASELLTVGDQSHCGQSAEEENKNDPARSEVLESSILAITDHSHCGGSAAAGGENDSARSEVLASELLTVGDQSHCGESAEEENKNDPARSEVLQSSMLPITDHSHCGGSAAAGGENDSARSEVLASELLTVGDQSHAGETAEEENKNDPARSEVLESSILPITEPANPTDGIAPNNSDALPEERNGADEQHKDSTLDVSDVAMSESVDKNLLSTSPTSRPEASSLGLPANVSAKEVEEEKNSAAVVGGSVSSKSEATEIDNSGGEGGGPPTF